MEEYPGLHQAIQYTAEQPAATPQKGKRKQVGRACSQCAAAHVACSEHRPCTRCAKRGIQCLDRERKRRRRAEPEDGQDDVGNPMVASAASYMPLGAPHMLSHNQMYSLPPMVGHFSEYHLPDFFAHKNLLPESRINDMNGFKQEGRYSPPDIYNGHVGLDPSHFHFHYFPPAEDFGVPSALPVGDHLSGVNMGMGNTLGGLGMGNFGGLHHLENIHPLPSLNNFGPFPGFRPGGLGLETPQMSIPPPLIIPSNRSLSPLSSSFPDFPPPSIISNRENSPGLPNNSSVGGGFNGSLPSTKLPSMSHEFHGSEFSGSMIPPISQLSQNLQPISSLQSPSLHLQPLSSLQHTNSTNSLPLPPAATLQPLATQQSTGTTNIRASAEVPTEQLDPSEDVKPETS